MKLNSGNSFSLATIEDNRRYYDGFYPGFLLLRHALAFLIIAVHTRGLVMGVKHANQFVGQTAPGVSSFSDFIATLFSSAAFRPLGFALVGAFFAVSGFLVSGSAIRTGSIRTFLAFRGLRIFPALVSEVTLCALLLGPLTTTVPLSDYFSDPQFRVYFLNILGIAHYTLPGVFENNPMPRIINGNLWTLAPEFYCYLIMAVVMMFGIQNKKRLFGLIIVVLTLGIFANELTGFLDLPTRAPLVSRFSVWFVVYMFFVGVVFYLFSHKIILNFYLFLACVLGYFSLMIIGGFDTISAWLLGYCAIYVGMIDTRWFDRLIRNSDYSYGLYLYGLPIGQLMALLLVVKFGVPQNNGTIILLLTLTIVFTIAFSAVSWTFVERPALKFKRILAAKRPVERQREDIAIEASSS
ncbi:acyltransferase family protein [Beijerinckia indica]|uniref:Putative O-acetyl transferase n=1 Tax=Beijerinckia indica subsp. indica (strain ATCC 9039 / DSM 1715 / NCIMB 8712) TaxID=395963 RepID=B2ILL2_BEII9|nr:acyltransferase [Beijerinckia indica]ACB97412.1 putative O-acetyl transferase [Beijerinckia indica subsp. indica ATCC 9039]